jgi:CheY-like chemotaxis protein
VSEAPHPRRLRVLVVDDYPDSAETLRILLYLWGHEALVAPDGPSALRAAPAFRPDLALLDIQMPRMHGGELARRLRRLPGLRHLRILALSATEPDDPRLAGYAGVFDGHLGKPFSLDDLERLLACHAPCHAR